MSKYDAKDINDTQHPQKRMSVINFADFFALSIEKHQQNTFYKLSFISDVIHSSIHLRLV